MIGQDSSSCLPSTDLLLLVDDGDDHYYCGMSGPSFSATVMAGPSDDGYVSSRPLG